MKLNKIGYYEINFVDSAATNRMKTGSGAGESRLYLGQVSRFDEIYDFFSEDVRFYFFCKKSKNAIFYHSFCCIFFHSYV